MTDISNLTHHRIAANGTWLHCVTAGRDGPPILLLHGFPQTWQCWRKVMSALGDGFRFIVPDLRGLGDSDRPAQGYDAVTLAEDMAGLLNALKVGSLHVIAHDLGGPVGYALAATHPDVVLTLTLVECPLPGVGAPPQAIPATGEPIWHFGFHNVRDVAEALVAGRERLYLEYFYRHFAYDPSAIGSEDVDEYLRCYSAPGAMRAAFELYRAMPTTAARFAELSRKKLMIPVLAFGGAVCLQDDVLESARLVAENVEGGTVPRSGHWLPDERPDFLAEQLRIQVKRAV